MLTGRGTARRPGALLGRFGQRLGDPFADVALPPGPCRAEQVQADAAGDLGQPGAGGWDGLLLLLGHGVPAGVGLLDGILGLGQGAQQPVGEVEQLPPLADERAQARVGPAGSWLRIGWSWCRQPPLAAAAPHQVDDRASRGWRGVVMTPAGARLLQDLRRQLHNPSRLHEEVVDQTVTTAA
jgi:hypothetical protein